MPEEHPGVAAAPTLTGAPPPAGAGARRWPWRLARGAVLAIALGLLCRGITAPFNGWHELNSAMYSQFARNHIQYGLGHTRLYCTWGVTDAPPVPPERYLNHPPLIALWTAIPLVLFGDHEWSARLVPIASSVGSTALLMAILTRLAGPLPGTLAGFFFAVLPLTAYFGRMIDHVAPAQLFTLLMVYGYLRWTRPRAGPRRRRAGAVSYVLGAVLGIGTAWAVVIAAALVWAWHAVRVRGGRGEARLLLWLAAVPALALGAVVLHILAGTGGDAAMLRDLFVTRSLGGVGGRQPWSAWLGVQADYLVRNFTLPGAMAAAACATLLGARVTGGRGRRWGARAGLTGDLAAVLTLLGLHGLLYVLAFKNASWFHDYWQFFLAPFVAASLAFAAVTVRSGLAPSAPRLGTLLLVLLLLAPIPGTVRSLAFYARHVLVDPAEVEALRKLGTLVPHRAPAWTSHRWRRARETLGSHARQWSNPVIAYYADRPLLYSRDAEEVRANAPGCAAYLLRRNERASSRDLERTLSGDFERVPAGADHVIFLLDRPRGEDAPRRGRPLTGDRVGCYKGVFRRSLALPLYEYACPSCGTFERMQKFSDPILSECPTCQGPVEKLLSAPAIQFKGSGWYVTDYARKSSGKEGGDKGERGEKGEKKDAASGTDKAAKDSGGSKESPPAAKSPEKA